MATTKIHQLVAVLDGAKKQAHKAVSRIHHESQKTELFAGQAREYRPVDDDGEKLPSDSKKVQRTGQEFVDDAKKAWSGWIDDQVSLDVANTKATCEVFGVTIPSISTIFVQRRLEDWRTMIEKLPTLPLEKNWKWSGDRNCFVADEEQTRKTGKVPRAHVLYEATEKHPAQVEQYFEDVTIGWWHVKYMSGCIPEDLKKQWLDNIDAAIREVKQARGKANEAEVQKIRFAKKMHERIFGDVQDDPPPAPSQPAPESS